MNRFKKYQFGYDRPLSLWLSKAVGQQGRHTLYPRSPNSCLGHKARILQGREVGIINRKGKTYGSK